MYNRYIIEDEHHVPPFNEPASLLTIGNQPLKLHHEELFTRYLDDTCELANTFEDKNEINQVTGRSIVYRDNLWFDKEFLTYFMHFAKQSGRACRAAFSALDKAYATYTLPLAKGFEKAFDHKGNPIYMIDLWYFPDGYTTDVIPIVIPSDYREIGFFTVPDFMTMEGMGDLTHLAPMRAVMSIESWVHVYFATIIFGSFTRSARFEHRMNTSLSARLSLLWHAVIEQKQVLCSSGAVKIGKRCSIDPSAIITGPTEIGDGVSIGAGVVIDNCNIGNDVTIDAGCTLFQSSVANNCFLPFRASLYLTAVMENTIIAQNTCLQMCVIGRNSFVGAGSTFTDFNLVAQKPIRAANREGHLESVGQIVLGSGIGHNCRIGSGMVAYPGRMIESDVVLVASSQRRVISRSVTFEESDHHFVKGGESHQRLYPRNDEVVDLDVEEQW